MTEVSPIVPLVLPISIANESTDSPAFRFARGVGPVTPSYTKFVIFPAKQIRRKQRAPRAGFMKFCPSPPKSCFTTMIAKKAPTTPIHHGSVGGRFSARSNPVTTALKSLIVTGLCMSFSQRYSAKTAAAVVSTIKIHAFSCRKFQIPKNVAGSREITTISIILLLVTLSRICGEDDTL